MLFMDCRGFEDAYEDADEDTATEGPPARDRGGKRRRGSAKTNTRRKQARKDPHSDKAEAILAAGSHALTMHEDGQGQPATEMLGPAAPAVAEGNQQELEPETF